MRLRYSFLLGLFAASVAAPLHAQADDASAACPAAVPSAIATVHRFLGNAQFATQRDQYGVPRLEPDQVSALTAPDDAQVCVQLRELFFEAVPKLRGDWRGAFFESADFYYVVTGWWKENDTKPPIALPQGSTTVTVYHKAPTITLVGIFGT